MSLPDFTQVALTCAGPSSVGVARREPWLTPEGIAVKTAYVAADREALLAIFS